MDLIRILLSRCATLFSKQKLDNDLDEELCSHIDFAIEENLKHGMTKQEARTVALRAFGGVAQTKEAYRVQRGLPFVETLARDVRYSLRQLRKWPGFTLTAVLTLALGIGANTAIFTVVQSILLSPLPYHNADSLVVLDTHWTDSGHTSMRITGPDAVDVRGQARSLEVVSLYSGGSLGVQLRDHAVYTVLTFVDANFARVFSLQPIAGRLFTDADAHHAVLVGEQFARDNFGSTQAAVGQVLHVEGEQVQIAGVLPSGFDFPSKTQVWEASPLQPESHSRTAFNYKAVGLLRSGVGLKSAQAELNGISQRLETAYPGENRSKCFVARPLQQALTGDARPTLLLLWATVGLILLIACVNLTHLQLVRSMERQREIAIRKALGSSGRQVVQPVIVESLLVSLIGGAVGALLAIPAVHALVAMAPSELPRAAEIHLNGWVLTFTLALAVLTAMASSLIPALRAAKVDPAGVMKQDSSRGMGRRGASKLRDGLVMAEVAATFVLAMGAGLLLHTMMTLRDRDMGYLTRQLLVVDADAPAHTEEEAHSEVRQFNELFEELAALPGVEHVAGIMGLPTGNYGSNGYYKTRGGLPVVAGHEASSVFSVASPGYFQAMGIPVRQGRDISAQDTFASPFIAVISESLARQSFGDIDPLGKQIQCGLDSDRWMTVVGVVGDVRQDSPAELPGPALYMPMAQHPFYANQIHIVLRTKVKPLTLLNDVQNKIARTNPLIAMRFTTMDAMVNKSIAAERFRATLLSCFAGVGLLLAMLGVYGTMAYSVAQRTFEIGIRMAFGAEKGVILRGVLLHAAKLACSGIAIGLVVSFILGRLVTGMLVGVGPMDPLSLGAAAMALFLTALAAAFEPGWKATHVNPMVALRAE
jgi:predicted permease